MLRVEHNRGSGARIASCIYTLMGKMMRKRIERKGYRRVDSQSVIFFEEHRSFFAKKMSAPAVLVLSPLASSREFAILAAQKLNYPVVDPCSLYSNPSLTGILGAERVFCTTSEIALAVAHAGGAVVLDPVDNWCDRCNCSKDIALTVSILLRKVRRMLCNRLVRCAILSPLDDPRICENSLPTFCTLIRHGNDMPTLEEFEKLIPRGVPTIAVACNQVRVIYKVDDAQVKHETVLFDPVAQMVPLAWLDDSKLGVGGEATQLTIAGSNGCSLVLLSPRKWGEDERMGQHITLHPGKCGTRSRPPAKMRSVAKAVERGDATCCLGSEDVIDLRDGTRDRVAVCPVAWAVDAFAPDA